MTSLQVIRDGRLVITRGSLLRVGHLHWSKEHVCAMVCRPDRLIADRPDYRLVDIYVRERPTKSANKTAKRPTGCQNHYLQQFDSA